MKIKKQPIATLVVTIICLLTGKSAQASTLHNGWSYAIDSFNDSTQGIPLIVGGTDYEIYGSAVKQTNDTVYFAINTNLPIGGIASPALDGYTRWGDILINFSDQDLNTTSANSNLWGIRFDGLNESGVASTGLYQNVMAKSVAQANYGFVSLASHNNAVINGGGNPTIGDLSAFDPYFDQSQTVQNTIASGTKIGDINFLNSTELSTLGLDFSYFGASGSQTIAFGLDRNLFPEEGDFLYHLAMECDNDIIAGIEYLDPVIPESVPEASTVLGLLLVGLMGGSQLSKVRHVNQ